jgi:tRNA threonylcarbamoyladenosine biosynthesis protein TsaE
MEGFLTEIFSSSPEDTDAAGERIGRLLRPGAVLALRGALGAGKTCFAKGVARGLGVSEAVTSPTYTIISEYSGRIPFYHIDAYRLTGDDDFESVGGRELLSGAGVTLVEWSERLSASLPDDAITVEITITGETSRLIRVSGIDLDDA